MFEYWFDVALYYSGLHMMNLGSVAERFLEHWSARGLRPAFRIALTTRGEDRVGEVLVTRATPGWTVTGQSAGQRLRLLLRRGAFRSVANFLALLPCDDER